MKNKFGLLTWYFSIFVMLMKPAIASEEHEFKCLQRIRHSHCHQIGNFCHHQEEGLACLATKTLIKDDLLHFMNQHLGNDISKLNLSYQKELDSRILVQGLASSDRSRALVYLNLFATNVGYAGILELLKSSTFGSLRSDYPTYYRQSGLPVSVIEIDISQSRAYTQYKNRNFKYPLPIIRDFEIIYGHFNDSDPLSRIGYKQIILLNNGKELENNTR